MKANSGHRRIVIKIGTSVLAKSFELDEKKDSPLKSLVEEICILHSQGWEILLVTSGAIGMGMKLVGQMDRPEDIRKKQALAAIGQVRLMRMYEDLFKAGQTKVAQVLLTRGDFDDRQRYLNARNTLCTLLELKVVPIINENDTVAIEEIRFGDNDQLSSLVAAKMDADLLVLLSDVEGLYRSDTKNSKEVIHTVTEISEIKKHVRPSKSALGTGGMASKLEAAKVATSSGVTTIIASAFTQGVLRDILSGEEVGTKFIALKSLTAKKRWILFGAVPKGEIMIDDGAVSAILERSKSLLFPGIKEVHGDFFKGDVVRIKNLEGREMARGIISYASEELKNGRNLFKEVIHRDALAIGTAPYLLDK